MKISKVETFTITATQSELQELAVLIDYCRKNLPSSYHTMKASTEQWMELLKEVFQ